MSDNKTDNSRDRGLEEKGFVLNENGKPLTINPTIYANYILKNFKLVITEGQRFYIYENNIWRYINTEEELARMLIAFLNKDVPNFWTSAIERRYIEGLKRLAPKVTFDDKKRYINLKNGVFDLEKDKLKTHSSKYLTTVRIPIEYDPDAQCPKFKTFLRDIFRDDDQLIRLVKEVLGYCLTTEVKAQKGFIFFGTGANGKSVLAEVMTHLYGPENISSLSINDLDSSFARSEIVSKTVNISTENEVNGKGLNTQYLKSIIAGDLIRIEEKYKKGFSYKPFCKIIFCCNALPYSADNSHGFYRRLIIIPFEKTIPHEKQNKDLVSELVQELQGIFSYSLQGLRRLKANNYIFSRCLASERMMQEYRREIEPVFDFIEDNIESTSEEQKISRSRIFLAFRSWCRNNNHVKAKDISNRRFWKKFRETLKSMKIVAVEGKSNGQEYFAGITLKKHDNSPELGHEFNKLLD